MTTRIAIPTDDGKTLAAHFGRATHYAVATVEDHRVIAFELRPQASRHVLEDDGGSRPHDHDHSGPDADARHDAMLDPVRDCDVIVARGIGPGARERVVTSGIELVVTTTPLVGDVARLYAAGRLPGLDDDTACTRQQALHVRA